MKFILKSTALLLFIICSSVNYSQSLSKGKEEQYINLAEKITSTALSERKGYGYLKEITDIGTRLSGSENSLKAIVWAKAKMNELGFDRVWAQPVRVPHWVRGNVEEAKIVKSGNQEEKFLNVAALGGSVGTDENGLTAEVVEVKDMQELKFAGDKLKDKIVFINEPMDESIQIPFRAYGKAVQKRVFGAIQAAKHGAVGVIIRSITTRFDNVPHTGVMLYVDSIPKIPAVAAGYLDSDYLSEALSKNPNLKVNLKLSCKTLPDVQSYNVIGDIIGSEKPDEIVIVSGHFDSWDKGQGAHDDGAGSVHAIETLDLLKRLNLKPKRTIRAILFINEENGSRGAREYAAYSDTSTEKHIAALESDAGGFNPRAFSVSADSTVISKVKGWLPILNKTNIMQIVEGGSGADISKIKKIKALFGLFPSNQRYFDYHHSDNDVFSEVNPRELEMGSAAMTVLAYLISEEGL